MPCRGALARIGLHSGLISSAACPKGAHSAKKSLCGRARHGSHAVGRLCSGPGGSPGLAARDWCCQWYEWYRVRIRAMVERPFLVSKYPFAYRGVSYRGTFESRNCPCTHSATAPLHVAGRRMPVQSVSMSAAVSEGGEVLAGRGRSTLQRRTLNVAAGASAAPRAAAHRIEWGDQRIVRSLERRTLIIAARSSKSAGRAAPGC